MYPQPHFDPQKEVKWGQRGPNLIFSISSMLQSFFFFFFYKTMMTSKESWHNAEFKKEKKCASMFYYGKSDNFQILFFITIEIDQMSLPANFSKVLL